MFRQKDFRNPYSLSLEGLLHSRLRIEDVGDRVRLSYEDMTLSLMAKLLGVCTDQPSLPRDFYVVFWGILEKKSIIEVTSEILYKESPMYSALRRWFIPFLTLVYKKSGKIFIELDYSLEKSDYSEEFPLGYWDNETYRDVFHVELHTRCSSANDDCIYRGTRVISQVFKKSKFDLSFWSEDSCKIQFPLLDDCRGYDLSIDDVQNEFELITGYKERLYIEGISVSIICLVIELFHKVDVPDRVSFLEYLVYLHIDCTAYTVIVTNLIMMCYLTPNEIRTIASSRNIIAYRALARCPRTPSDILEEFADIAITNYDTELIDGLILNRNTPSDTRKVLEEKKGNMVS